MWAQQIPTQIRGRARDDLERGLEICIRKEIRKGIVMNRRCTFSAKTVLIGDFFRSLGHVMPVLMHSLVGLLLAGNATLGC